MLCNNCGYENPREHRYCGMCGTPFSVRIAAAPEAQSRLAFGSVPVEIEPAPLQTHIAAAVEPPPMEAPAELAEVADQLVAEPMAATAEAAVVEAPEPYEVAAEPAAIVEAASEELQPVVEVASEVAHAVEAPVSVELAAEETAEAPEPVMAEVGPPVEPEPVAEPEWAAKAEPAEELTPAAEGAAVKEPEVEAPALEVHAPAARVIVMPRPRPHPMEPAASATPAASPAILHPSPDTLPFTPPPASAGMPTFQEVAQASGAPPISPFEPPVEKDKDEERELQEFVASFRWTPPAETADELTMRSEAPVIDEEAPAEFHHPSFDDDVPPPPEAGPHPTGEEYYPAAGGAERSRFLEISEQPTGSDGGAFKAGLNDEAPAASNGKRWLWATVAALVAVFGGLGFLEGRAQSTHAFRGPLEVAREFYDRVRQQLAQPEKAPAKENSGGDAKPAAAPPQAPATEADKTQADKTVPGDASAGPAPQPQTAATNTESASKQAVTAAGDEAAKSAPAKPIPAPPAPKASGKPQPGQQELAKAMEASDATAAAAWLWKATSRGNPEAPVRLADMYIRGNGVPKSCEQAMVLLRSAATKENAPARNRLAALYANGTCVARDRVKAYQLMSSALVADPSSEWAKENREQLWNQMTASERAMAQTYRPAPAQ